MCGPLFQHLLASFIVVAVKVQWESLHFESEGSQKVRRRAVLATEVCS